MKAPADQSLPQVAGKIGMKKLPALKIIENILIWCFIGFVLMVASAGVTTFAGDTAIAEIMTNAGVTARAGVALLKCFHIQSFHIIPFSLDACNKALRK